MERPTILDRETRGGTRPRDHPRDGGEQDHQYDFDRENLNHQHQFLKLDPLNDQFQYFYHDETLK